MELYKWNGILLGTKDIASIERSDDKSETETVLSARPTLEEILDLFSTNSIQIREYEDLWKNYYGEDYKSLLPHWYLKVKMLLCRMDRMLNCNDYTYWILLHLKMLY